MTWFKEDFYGDSKHLVIALGSFYEGLNKKFNPNQFEWDRSLTKISEYVDFKKLYVTDKSISWWHGKFEGLGHGIHLVADFLKKEAEKAEVEKVLVIGPSLGGYGALMFTCLCNFDVAIAISPQTKLTTFRYKKNHLHEKFEGLNVNKDDTDVKLVMDKYGKPGSRYFIYYGDKHGGDVTAANRLANCPGVILCPLDSAHHTVARLMRYKGMTQDIIIRFVKDEL